MGRILTVLGGLGAGAALMYFMDPERGRTRRAHVQDKFTGLSNDLRHGIEGRSQDLRNRAKGLLHDANPPSVQIEVKAPRTWARCRVSTKEWASRRNCLNRACFAAARFRHKRTENGLPGLCPGSSVGPLELCLNV